MKQEYLEKKASQIKDEELFNCIEDTLFNALKMLTLTAKKEHARIFFEGILSIIRYRFNDFTINQIDSAIRQGSYGEFGDYTKLNPKTILDWFGKKRVEISINNERTGKDEKRLQENSVIPCKRGGDSILLGLLYFERGFVKSDGNEMTFNERLQLIESGKKCPFTGEIIMSMIRNYNPTDFFKMVRP